MSYFTRSAIALIAMAATVPAMAQNHNGTRDVAFYGTPYAVQNTQTQFGDSNLGVVDFANGSELDALYGRLDNGALHLFLSGNLESNFNKLEIFLDTTPGGQNVLRGDNPDVDFNGLNRMAGMTLPTGFAPDRYISVTGGGGAYQMFGNFAELLTGGGGTGNYLGNNTAATNAAPTGGTNPFGIQFTINNSNVAGVSGGTGLADQGAAAAVLTGIELKIPFAALGGNPINGVGVFAFINGSGHDFVSNQILGGLNGGGNLGEPTVVDFANTSAQAVVVIPEAGTGVLTVLPLLGLVLGTIVRRIRKN